MLTPADLNNYLIMGPPYVSPVLGILLRHVVVVVVVGAPGRPTGFTPYPAKDSLFGLFLEQAESWYTGYRAISS